MLLLFCVPFICSLCVVKEGSAGSCLYFPTAAVTQQSLFVGLDGSGERPAATLVAPVHTGHTQTQTHTHTENNLHTSLWSQCSLSVWARVAQTNKNGFHSCKRSNMHTQTYTQITPTCNCNDIPAHILRNTHSHTIPRAQYRVHYFGMPQCFPLNTRCTQTVLGLTGVSHTGLQQTDMIA